MNKFNLKLIAVLVIIIKAVYTLEESTHIQDNNSVQDAVAQNEVFIKDFFH